MDFLKEYWFWFAAAVILVGDPWLKRKKPKLWWRIQLPSLVCMSTISAVFIALLVRVAWVVGTSEIKVLDRVFFFLLIIGCIAAFMLGNIRTWRDWRREKKRREEESDL